EVDEQGLAAPAVEHVAQRRDVADRLRHLLAVQLQESVVHPDVRELAARSLRLGAFVLVMREDEVEAAEMNLETRPEELLCHGRALDVPAGAAASPGRFPTGVLALLVRLPEREVTRVFLERVRLLLFDLIGAL